MKQFFVFLIVCTLSGICLAQSSVKDKEPEDVKVVNATWQFGYGKSVGSDPGPTNLRSSSVPIPNTPDEPDQNNLAGKKIVPLDTKIATDYTTHRNAAIVTFQNSGSKQIKSLKFDFVFLNAESGTELMRYPFSERVKIKAGETTRLVSEIADKQAERYGPVDGSNIPKNGQVNFHVVIKRIDFADGTFWESK